MSGTNPEQGGHDATLAPGAKVGEYVVEALIGTGTFGSVYRAIQPLIGKQVAIKILSRKYSADPPTVSRFIAEARAVNQIRHKNLIDIFSFGQLEDGRHYHVMELLVGRTLEDILRLQSRLEPEDIFMVLRGLARALDAAHAAGIAHRDLKPANVFITKNDDGIEFPKLLDFGIAKLLTDEMPRQHSTATGAAVGTPDYMSPEQCKGPDVDHRTDVYAFGVLAFRLLTGKLPFTGDNVVEVLMKHMTEDPPQPSTVQPELPHEFDAPLLGLLAKERDGRPNSSAEAVRQLEDAAEAAGWTLSQNATSSDALARVASIAPTTGSPFADTLASGERLTPKTDESKRPWPLFLGLGAMAAGVLAIPVLLEAPDEPKPVAKVAPPPVAPPPPVIKQAPVEKPPPAVPKTVIVTILGAPAKTKVFGPGGKELGTLPGSIELPYGKDEVSLRLKAAGYRPLSQTFTPVASSTITVSMRPVRTKTAPPPPPKKPHRDAIEEPDWE